MKKILFLKLLVSFGIIASPSVVSAMQEKIETNERNSFLYNLRELELAHMHHENDKYAKCAENLKKFLSENPKHINNQDELYQAPVHVALELLDIDLLKLFLNYKPNLSIKNIKGETALHLACASYLHSIKEACKGWTQDDYKKMWEKEGISKDGVLRIGHKNFKKFVSYMTKDERDRKKQAVDKMIIALDCIKLLLQAKAPYHRCVRIKTTSNYVTPSLAQSTKKYISNDPSDEAKKWLYWLEDAFNQHGSYLKKQCKCVVVYSRN